MVVKEFRLIEENLMSTPSKKKVKTKRTAKAEPATEASNSGKKGIGPIRGGPDVIIRKLPKR
jgi:hypothetical protein